MSVGVFYLGPSSRMSECRLVLPALVFIDIYNYVVLPPRCKINVALVTKQFLIVLHCNTFSWKSSR